ncbi:oligosaccharyl transferase, archaeosortase A system-associated [Methanococcoides sp. SA1]|nr:oligosaccharyl transferase, archaeosortase A system-associated [Methanococcoides sp. SA1]
MAEKKKNWDIKGSIPYFIGVVISFLIAFDLRTIPKAGVFISSEFVRFRGNDPWYHLRNVESIVHNYPHMLWFDAYTNYPTGTGQVFAPLYDMFLATIIWLIGFGNPSQDLIYTVCAYFPVVLGSLVVIPTYYIGKWLFDRRAGLLAAFFISVSSGQFLSRSIIGFNDHHIAETLLSTVTAMFLIMAVKNARDHNISFEGLKNGQFSALRSSLPYFILAGISLGAYTLAWKGALFFSLIIGVYVTVQHVLDHMHGKKTDYMAIGGMIIFVVALVMVAMTPYLGGTKALHLKALLAGLFAFPIMTLVSIEMNRRDFNKYYYPGSLIVSFVAVVLISKIALPSAYDIIISVFSYFMRTGGGMSIAEAAPLLSRGGVFTLAPLWYNFALFGYVSFIALALFAYEATKKNSQEKTFLIVWAVMIIWAMLQQNRFAYYYSVNAAILSAYLGIKLLDLAGWSRLQDDVRTRKESVSTYTSFMKNVKPIHILSLILIVGALAYPSYGMAVQQSQGVGGPNYYWIDATLWLRNNTPDPGLDYYENYEVPVAGESYQYPEEAYGVMSWWDYGHWIEIIGHRIPNANPFQQGIGGRTSSLEEENRPGASTFFTAQSEEEATAVLEAVHPDPDRSGARYVVTDVEMATGKFYAMALWTLDTNDYYVPVQTEQGVTNAPGERYFNSMEARLHIFDGDGLEQYRMVYESPAATATQEKGYKQVYNVLHGGSIPVADTGYVKIFEYVNGATIRGNAPAGETITLSTTIKTLQQRSFTYSQTMISDGNFEFVVPYSMTGPIEGETNFVVRAEPYTISYENTSVQIPVTEKAVLEGDVINI